MLVKRAIALCLGLLLAMGAIIPLSTNDAEAGPRHKKQRKYRHYKKYTKKWWRQYRRNQARHRAIAKRKRMIRLRQLRLARAAEAAKANGQEQPVAVTSKKPAASPQALPSGDPAPAGWVPSQSSPAELQFRVDNSSGTQVGSASIAVVGPAVGGSTGKTVGGVATTALRRDVIDRMIKENGWVVNDYQKEIGGQNVYVVVAQSQARNGAVQQRMFYFTEVDGKIYNVATTSPVNESERLAEESEKVINSLKARIKPGLRASR
jgi:hypothetical protein